MPVQQPTRRQINDQQPPVSAGLVDSPTQTNRMIALSGSADWEDSSRTVSWSEWLPPAGPSTKPPARPLSAVHGTSRSANMWMTAQFGASQSGPAKVQAWDSSTEDWQSTAPSPDRRQNNSHGPASKGVGYDTEAHSRRIDEILARLEAESMQFGHSLAALTSRQKAVLEFPGASQLSAKRDSAPALPDLVTSSSDTDQPLVELDAVGLPPLRRAALDRAVQLANAAQWSSMVICTSSPRGTARVRDEIEAVANAAARPSPARIDAMGLNASFRVASRALVWQQTLKDSGTTAAMALQHHLKPISPIRRSQSAASNTRCFNVETMEQKRVRLQNRAQQREERMGEAQNRSAKLGQQRLHRALHALHSRDRARAIRERRERWQQWRSIVHATAAALVLHHAVVSARAHALLLVQQTKAAGRVQTWWRGELGRMFVVRFKRAVHIIRWAFAGFVLRWRFRRCSKAATVVRTFLADMKTASRQRYTVLRFHQQVKAARMICKRWKVVLLRRDARSSLMESQLRTAELRIMVRYALAVSRTKLGIPTSRAAALAETLTMPARLRQLSNRLHVLQTMATAPCESDRLDAELVGAANSAAACDDAVQNAQSADTRAFEVTGHGSKNSPGRPTPSGVSSRANKAKQQHEQTIAFVEAVLAKTPRLPDELIGDEAFRLARFIESEHRDMFLHHQRMMRAMEPFFIRKRREAEISQRIHHAGSAKAFRFEQAFMKPGTYPWEAPKLCIRQSDEFIFANVMRMRRAMNRLRPDPGWLLGTPAFSET